MATIETLTGGCLCGAVRYTARDVEPHYHACHCNMCRRWGGGPFLGVDAGAVSFESEDRLRRFDSSEWAARGFCGDCGSSLFYHFKPEDRYVLCAGSFDDQDGLELALEIYVDQRPPGYEFAGERPAMTEAEVLARNDGDA
jgi:hypothetical protein